MWPMRARPTASARIAPDGRTTTLPGSFDTPSGVAVDKAGNVYVADTGRQRDP